MQIAIQYLATNDAFGLSYSSIYPLPLVSCSEHSISKPSSKANFNKMHFSHDLALIIDIFIFSYEEVLKLFILYR